MVISACKELGADELESFSGMKKLADTYEQEDHDESIRAEERKRTLATNRNTIVTSASLCLLLPIFALLHPRQDARCCYRDQALYA